jgi:indole-3-glycerol phosphate synthase
MTTLALNVVPEQLPNQHFSRISPEVQGSHHWQPPTGALGALVDRAYDRARELDAQALRAKVDDMPPPPSFLEALKRPDVAVIAEVKRRSPSKGEINATLRAGQQAAAYVAGGAAALSVLTEPEQFGGSAADLAEARGAVSVPLLRKDFIVDFSQVVEARALGASAVLLIVKALDPLQLADLMEEAAAFDLTSLVEIHDEAELELALASKATVIGVNNRDLETLAVDLQTSIRLIPKIPPSVTAIAESGIRDRSGVELQASAGADAVLCGSAVSAAEDPTAAVRALVGVTRVCRP